MKEFWNERYAVKDYVYGRTPNTFFKQFIDNETPKTILLPSEGEGRNAVYAASKGWNVFAIDFSEVARKKALQWADENNVSLHYQVADIVDWNEKIKTDCVGLIYAHFHADIRENIHHKLIEKVIPGGKIILESFSKKQIGYETGGPKSLDLLYDIEILKNDFASLQIELLQERTVNLVEGDYHRGEASVVRMIAKKPE
jgi:SAM-dependent methyltransferase